MQALFKKEGEYFIPSEAAASPWGPITLHGGASTALMVSAMEDRFSADEMQMTRLTVDLFRSVPKAPLRVECETVRDGKRVKMFDVSLYHEDVEVCRASGLVLQKSTVDVPDYAINDVALPEHIAQALDRQAVIGIGSDHRMHEGTPTPGLHRSIPLKPVFLNIGIGHGCSWLKLPVLVIEGRANTPLLSVAALADFANGFSQVHLSEEVGFINADLTVNLFRMPASEWLCIDSRAFPQSTGLSMVESVLYDESGMIGRVTQSNLTMPRFKA
ncbi:MAG: thioesterase family protein [Porticoccaceae bacterium]|nr:thioesterase family protein [Porticoccaceae bacterium]